MVHAAGVLSHEDIQERSNTWQSWVVVFSASLFFFYEFMQLNMFNAINPALLREFSISAGQLGQLSANYFYANILFLFPAGILLDRFSVRRIILLAMLLSVVSTFVFSMTHAILVAQICRFITGIGGSFCLLSAIKLASRWFPARRMALITGLIVTFAMIGGVTAQTPLTLLTDGIGWRATLLADAGLGVIFIFIIGIFVRDFPPDAAKHKQHAHLATIGFWRSLQQALLNTQNWLGGLYTSLMNLPIMLLGAMWGSLYLVQVYHISRARSSIVVTMIFLGTIIGSPLLGWFSDRLARRRSPMILCAVASLALILTLMYVNHLGFITLLLIFLGIGFFTSAQVIGYPLVAESNPPALTATAVGLAAMLIMSGGLSQPFFGWLMGLHWDHTLVNHVPIYSVHDYRLAMAIMPIAFVLSWITALLARETYCKPQE